MQLNQVEQLGFSDDELAFLFSRAGIVSEEVGARVSADYLHFA